MSEEDHTPSYYQLNKDKIYAKKKIWIEKNKEKVKEINKRWRDKNKEAIAEQKKYYNKIGYYKNKLVQKFNIMKDEILIGNDSQELLEEFKVLLDEMMRLELLDHDEYEQIEALL